METTAAPVAETRTEPLYRILAQAVVQYDNCIKSDNQEWRGKTMDRINRLVKNYLPSGSGFDAGTKLDLEMSDGDKLVFHTSFHHMDQNGMYDRWTEHTVTVRASLAFGMDIKISGRNRNEIKDLIHDEFRTCLSVELTRDEVYGE